MKVRDEGVIDSQVRDEEEGNGLVATNVGEVNHWVLRRR
jgi:hypothetical protein